MLCPTGVVIDAELAVAILAVVTPVPGSVPGEVPIRPETMCEQGCTKANVDDAGKPELASLGARFRRAPSLGSVQLHARLLCLVILMLKTPLLRALKSWRPPLQWVWRGRVHGHKLRPSRCRLPNCVARVAHAHGPAMLLSIVPPVVHQRKFPQCHAPTLSPH